MIRTGVNIKYAPYITQIQNPALLKFYSKASIFI